MTAFLDLDAYLDRIQWGGGTAPTFATLAGLLNAHMSHIHFENLDVLLKRPVRLDLDSLQDKLIRNRRGGYCFEHGTLLAAVLDQLGFRAVSHTARVVLMTPRLASPRTHMFLKVSLPGGEFIVDPGLGGMAPRVPVPLKEDAAEPVDFATHWMIRDDPYWVLRVKAGDKIVDAWVSTLDPDNQVDFEMGNHFAATFPASTFVNRIMLRAFTPEGRVTLMNRDLTVWRGNEARTTQLSDRGALRAMLVEHFGFDLPEVDHLRVPTIPEWA
ncbi:MAG: arylamine N-acetyltransferase [Betaproteobacteria bacterium]|nr:arylamine N-acetyltransferase [Betaproteobacteria bacterium]